MSSTNPPSHTAKLDRILADAQRDREMGYRDKALKMYPHVCGRCAQQSQPLLRRTGTRD